MTNRKGSALIIGAGPGLGRALADTFARAGHPVGVFGRSEAAARELAADLGGGGREVRAYTADAGSAESLRTALAVAVDQLGVPEILVYNAAAIRQDAPLDLDADAWAETFSVNVIGAAVAAEAVIAAFAASVASAPEAHSLSVLFTGGGLALEPSPEYTSLSVGKAALRAYAKALAASQHPKGVHVAVVTICGFLAPGDPRFDPATVAQSYLALHREPRDAWQDEIVYA
jgi:NAD(P)-dependent dehydrogenase (short-subunit alcohol dehydrogenase family)